MGTPQPTVDEAACCYSCGIDPDCKFFTYEGGEHGLCHHKNTDAPDCEWEWENECRNESESESES